MRATVAPARGEATAVDVTRIGDDGGTVTIGGVAMLAAFGAVAFGAVAVGVVAVGVVAVGASAARSFGGFDTEEADSEPADAPDILDPSIRAPASSTRAAAAHRAMPKPLTDADDECTNADHRDCRVI